MADNKTLLELLDSAAISLLKCINPDKVEGDAQPEPVPLADKTRAFDAAVKYLGERNKIAPEGEKAKPQIARLKDRLNGVRSGSPRSRRTPDADEAEIGSASSDTAGTA
jgi:hypothetical protein